MRPYGSLLTATTNAKGVLDIDPVKGCYDGIRAHSGCPDLCGINFKRN